MALTPSRVAVLRALGLGDLLAGVPALRALARALPESRLTLLTPEGLGPLVELAGLPMEVHHLDGLAQPPDLAADVAVNLHGRGPQSHRLLRSIAPSVVGFANAEADVSGPPWRPDEHERDRWCRLVAEEYGVPADPADVVIDAPAGPSVVDGAVVVHPGAASAARRWPPERYAAVVDALTERGLPVAVTGSANERELAARVAHGRARVLAGRTDVRDLAGVVAHARAVVCGDSGIAHLAVAYRTPSVQLFGPTPPSLWGPPADGPHTVLWHGRGPGDPHAGRVDPALAKISVAEVLSALARRLREPTRSSGPARPPVAPAAPSPAHCGSG